MSESEDQASAPQELERGSSGSVRDAISALKCMVSFFTIIRLDVGQREMDCMERKFWLVPALGLLNGLMAFIVCTILGFCGIGVLGQAVAALATVYIFSKFLHFDGLTDFGDGMIVSSGKREDHIRALKDSLIGAGGFGVALTVVLLTVCMYYEAGTTVYAGYYRHNGNYLIFGVGMLAFCLEILVKNAQVAAAAFGEPGNGMASRQVRDTTMKSLLFSTILTVILLAVVTAVCWWFGHYFRYYSDIELAYLAVCFVVAVLMSVLTGYVLAHTANKTFGFVNGDILGATNEISRAAILIVSVLILGLW